MFYDNDGKRYSTITENGIYGFFGEYRFLSNFHICTFQYDGLTFNSSEAAYMSCKTNDQERKKTFSRLTSPSDAKKLGQQIELVPNWDYLRVLKMYDVLYAKFSQCPKERALLLNTGNKYLEETNDWGDLFWGKDLLGNGVGMLGEVLMSIRRVL